MIPGQDKGAAARKWVPVRESRRAKCLAPNALPGSCHTTDRQRSHNVRSWIIHRRQWTRRSPWLGSASPDIGVRWTRSALLDDQDRPILLEFVPIRLPRSKVETAILPAGALKKHTPADHPCRRTQQLALCSAIAIEAK